MIVVIHPTGNANVRHLVGGLYQEALLAMFCTTLGVGADEEGVGVLPWGLGNELLRRSYPIPARKIWRRPGLEIVRLTAGRLCRLPFATQIAARCDIDLVYRALDRSVAKCLDRLQGEIGARCVFGYMYGCYESFMAAKGRGMKCLYELPIAYWETADRLLREEMERWPNWTETLRLGSDACENCARRTQELEMADVVFCPSEFVARSLPEVVASRRAVFVAHFGGPSIASGITKDSWVEVAGRNSRRPLRAIFVGGMSQRKGLADLLTAMKLLKRSDVELIVMGAPMMGMDRYRREFAGFRYEEPRSHSKVLKLMQTCDVLVLPSIVEGRALVVQEAMSQGLAIIVTANTGAEDLVDGGKNGFLVPIRSPEALANRLDWMAENRGATMQMGINAMRTAKEMTWARYLDSLIGGLRRAIPKTFDLCEYPRELLV